MIPTQGTQIIALPSCNHLFRLVPLSQFQQVRKGLGLNTAWWSVIVSLENWKPSFLHSFNNKKSRTKNNNKKKNNISLLEAKAPMVHTFSIQDLYFILTACQFRRERKKGKELWLFQHLISVRTFQDAHRTIKTISSFVSELWRKSVINRAAVQFYFTFICTDIENEQQGRPQVLKH